VTRVYLDAEVAAVPGPGDSRRVDEAAVESLRFLVEAGHEVVLVAPPADPGAPGVDAAPADLPGDLIRAVVDAVPPRPPTSGWYLTTSVERCQGTSARTRTVLIGGQPPSGAIHRCDTVARDLRAAVLEILASEAMPPA
jgi:hypothetical protein